MDPDFCRGDSAKVDQCETSPLRKRRPQMAPGFHRGDGWNAGVTIEIWDEWRDGLPSRRKFCRPLCD